jgi:hypothetical protein
MQYRRPLMRPARNMLQRPLVLLLPLRVLPVLGIFEKGMEIDFFLLGTRIMVAAVAVTIAVVMVAAVTVVAIAVVAVAVTDRRITCKQGEVWWLRCVVPVQ